MEPKMKPAKVFIVPYYPQTTKNGWDMNIYRMYQQEGYEPVETIKDADIVQFCGGIDVHPRFYGQKPAFRGTFSPERDEYEERIFEASEGKLRVGICRGAQFLNVMCGGTLWQDVNNHAIGGTHEAFTPEGRQIEVTSTHHQMLRDDSDQEHTLLLYAKRATRKLTIDKEGNPWENYSSLIDVEAMWYPRKKVFCYQPHPEYKAKGHSGRDYFFEVIQEVL
jgi:phosphoribosylformylglycinamidine (FGAM) synthase-like amidotransferase family enzyme